MVEREDPREPAVGPVIAALSAHIVGACQRDVPAEVIAKAKQHILDTLAAMVSGAALPPGRAALSYIQALGGRPEAMVAGSGFLTTAINAAMANGMLAHADETDDSHSASLTHPGCAVVPAAMAMSERQGASGLAFLRAIIVGYDVCCRVTQALGVPHLTATARSTHAIGGLFGAAAAAGALANLSVEQVRHLISYTVQQASGVYCWVRDKNHIEKAFDFAGMPARNGVTAATMVQAGMTGVDDALSGDRNFFDAFSPAGDPAELARDLGRRYEILNADIKKWSVGSPSQTVLDAFEALIRDHAPDPTSIERIEIHLPKNAAWVVSNGSMPAVCVEHLAAVMLIDGGMTFASTHDQARMHNSRVLDLRRRVVVVPSEELERARPSRQAIVTLRRGTGAPLSHHARVVRGSRGNPMSDGEVKSKALDLMAPILGPVKSRGLLTAIQSLETLQDIRTLRDFLQADSPPRIEE